MELDFDKEIDAILRKAHRDGPVLVGDFANANHLDADEISAFAENAMPENSRALYSAHLAECDRCRKILSNLLVMNSEAAPVESAPGVVAVTTSAVPWYRQLFLFPNLAYVMGGLVLVFGGFLALTVVQNSKLGDSGLVSQTTETESTQGGPYFEAEPPFAANANMTVSANTAANMAAPPVGNATANTNAGAAPGKGVAETRAARDENNFAADGTTSDAVIAGTAPPAAVAAPPPPPTTADEQSRAREADLPKAKVEDKAAGLAMRESEKKDTSTMRQTSPGALSSSQSGPMQNNQSQYNRQLESLNKPDAKNKMTVRRDDDSSSGRKVVGGKTFDRKQGVWYDTSYQGRPTINVRRGTDEFNRLDGGLRSVANSLAGTVVIVWGAKAYRIQ